MPLRRTVRFGPFSCRDRATQRCTAPDLDHSTKAQASLAILHPNSHALLRTPRGGSKASRGNVAVVLSLQMPRHVGQPLLAVEDFTLNLTDTVLAILQAPTSIQPRGLA